MLRFLTLCLALIASTAHTEEVVLGLSQDQVAITTNFDGSEILLFGAVKREAPIPEEPLDVVIAVSGPSGPLTVRRKERKFGIWVNTDAVEIDAAPSFYAVATSAPFNEVISNVEDQRHKVSIPRAIRSIGAPMEVEDAQSFSEAVIRIRTDEGLYQLRENTVQIEEQTLFRTSIQMPANLTEGDYPTRIFLTRNGKVVSQFETVINVNKVGLERWLYDLSRNQPLIYGIMSLAIAIAAGWLASAAFQILRRN
ncbi:TIGR02186 family protein [Shimia sp. MMG029]|uniref:TIGR02186 family protein n=1 Tax=Shimia sp. MMG029 TaxID=3021978 RepID=UPI0022FDBB56|nr:TIGR02186 family protein [Shimia sp. MMG029]MDA5558651.1 TIGR02186 family protein [Shimia sp. MMG029]